MHRPYSEHILSPEVVGLFTQARDLVDAYFAVPDPLPNVTLRCHEMARAVTRLLDPAEGVQVHVEDGKFGAVEHSWLLLVGRGPAILDVYAVGTLPPVQLHDMSPALPTMRNYEKGFPRTDIREDVVDTVVAAMISGATHEMQTPQA